MGRELVAEADAEEGDIALRGGPDECSDHRKDAGQARILDLDLATAGQNDGVAVEQEIRTHLGVEERRDLPSNTLRTGPSGDAAGLVASHLVRAGLHE